MTQDITALLATLGPPESHPAGQPLYEIGQKGDVLYVVACGEVQIRVGEIVFETVRPGGIVGEMVLLDGEARTRSATAIALTDCKVFAIDRDRLLEVVRLAPSFALQLTNVTVQRLRAANFLAHHDSATRLPNRALFLEACRIAIFRGRRRGTLVGVLCIRIEPLQSVSETHGYDVANRLLRDIAARLQGLHRERDVIARLGEDRLAVLLEDLQSTHEVTRMAHAVLEQLATPFPVVQENIVVTPSIGISCYPSDSEEPGVLLKNADTAAALVAELGRAGFAFHSVERRALSGDTHRLQDDLREAIGRDELSLQYQPRIAVRGGRITALEALLGWHHPGLGAIPPDRFIPVAEQTGMIVEIGEWVMRTACAQQKAWLIRGIAPERVAVNLSARQLALPDLTERVAAILAQTGLAPGHLELEITESAVVEDPVGAALQLEDLRELGVTVALDDFGTEYSSLGYLKQFPLDYMKIDQCFVRGIPEDAHDVAITKAVITLARNLGLKIVAEGVETAAQLAYFTEQACDEVQGYYFGQPVPAEGAETLLQKNRRDAAT